MSFMTASDDTKIFFKDMGDGFPVLLIHGWPVNADMWEYQTTALLRSGYRVIAYDRRGFGRSGQPAKGYDYDTFASDLNDLINHLELQKVALVGFSMGGGEIARYLSRYGAERISRVALVSSVVPYLLKTETNPTGVPAEEFDKMRQGLAEDRPHFLAGFAKTFYGDHMLKPSVSKEILDWTSFLAFQASPLATIDCVDAFGKTDFRPDMKAFTVPTLIIHGTGDKTVPIQPAGAAAAGMVPGAEYKPYDGAAHGLFITHKERLNADLLAFLNADASAGVFAGLPRKTASRSEPVTPRIQ